MLSVNDVSVIRAVVMIFAVLLILAIGYIELTEENGD
jgi:hypothetical protein